MTSTGRWGHVRSHATALGSVGVASIVGAVAAFVFQIVTARLVGPDDFGLLAAFFSIVNVAAIGSSALQNSVAVQTAGGSESTTVRAKMRVPVDALIVGLAGGILVLVLSPLLADALGSSLGIVVAAAVSIP